MTSRNCARAECGKTVYPMEELKCLDQIWHKQCFRCTTCSMVLSMKNYKGYNKMPYCEAHYPKTTATVVADTPEMKRLQEATKNQSLVKYHEEFEKNMKGKKIELADDPEMQRLKKNTQIQSNVVYHGEMDRKDLMEKTRPLHPQQQQQQNQNQQPLASPQAMNEHQPHHQKNSVPQQGPMSPTKAPATLHQDAQHKNSPYTAKQQQQSTLIYSSELGGRVNPPSRRVGKIDDYDPINGQWGSASVVRSPATGATGAHQQLPQGKAGPMSPTGGAGQLKRPTLGTKISGSAYRAMYDYTANDTDEVSFKEGDVIINCQSVDQGWMTGTVQRTGQWGMLPANYVEKVH